MSKTPKKDSSLSIRELAAVLVCEIMENGAYANLLLEKQLRIISVSPADRRMLTEIVNGSVRMVKHLDWVLNLFLKADISSQNRWLRNVLRISAYQVMFMERVPDYAAVNEAVAIMRKKTGPGLARVVNGVLRNLLRQLGQLSYPQDETEKISVYYSHPRWLVELLLEIYGRLESERIMAFDNHAPALVIRCNTLKNNPAGLLEEMENEGVLARISPCVPYALRIESLNSPLHDTKSFKEGAFYIQNEASMLAAAILSPEPGQRVYDLCCGVGGKSTHMAEFMNNHGQIAAFDLYSAKLKLLEQNCERLGISIVKGFEYDLTRTLEQFPAGQRVLLDAPCSGLGVLARRADSRWKKSPEMLQNLAGLQRSILENASGLVESGGCLLYSTCTINPAENQEVVQDFLQRHRQFELMGFADRIDFWKLKPEDKKAAERGMLCLLPGTYDTDGMFYALMRRH